MSKFYYSTDGGLTVHPVGEVKEIFIDILRKNYPDKKNLKKLKPPRSQVLRLKASK